MIAFLYFFPLFGFLAAGFGVYELVKSERRMHEVLRKEERELQNIIASARSVEREFVNA